MRESWSRPRYDGAEEESPIGAKITTYTMLGVPYYKYSIIYSKTPFQSFGLLKKVYGCKKELALHTVFPLI